jgi:hypothetical protein
MLFAPYMTFCKIFQPQHQHLSKHLAHQRLLPSPNRSQQFLQPQHRCQYLVTLKRQQRQCLHRRHQQRQRHLK